MDQLQVMTPERLLASRLSDQVRVAGPLIAMTQDDIDNGRMTVEIGVAPIKLANFVIARISQKAREATG